MIDCSYISTLYISVLFVNLTAVNSLQCFINWSYMIVVLSILAYSKISMAIDLSLSFSKVAPVDVLLHLPYAIY